MKRYFSQKLFGCPNLTPVFYLVLMAVVGTGCAKDSNTRFKTIKSSTSGVHFRNDLTPTSEMNIFNYLYFYNGGGTAIGDVDGDGLPDIYFSANQLPNQLYLNQGGFKFKEVAKAAGVQGPDGWTTGVAMADVNGDGRLDIYVCQLGSHLTFQQRNQLYINQGNNEEGIPVFKDEAHAYGLDIASYSTQVAFFDYDLDGDLDMYLLNHSVHNNGTFGKRGSLLDEPHPTSGDRLFRNDGNHFVDVTQAAGIYSTVVGYGLGIITPDVNNDGWPDIYIANDFHENDYLYLNQKDGTFKEALYETMEHTSRFSMGCDWGDINNDGWNEIMTLDMLPEDPVILKSSAAEDAYDVYQYKLKYGYGHQFARNNLQFNWGLNPQNGEPLFAEIGMMSGIFATDWSWSTLFSDFDLDGYEDIFVSNGILRRSNDLDYINFITNDSIQARLTSPMVSPKDFDLFNQMPEIKLPNYMYHNNQDLTFTNVSSDWGLDKPSFSNGSAYADLDNDGDLDLVINNINDVAGIYENQTIQWGQDSLHFLTLILNGKSPNVLGIGTHIIAQMQGQTITRTASVTRGFQSSVDYRPSLGLGKHNKVDSLWVIWPDQTYQLLTDVVADQFLEVNQNQAEGLYHWHNAGTASPLAYRYKDLSATTHLDHVHKENNFIEFNREPLIPHMSSQEGPALATGDVNGDGLQDLFMGAARHDTALIYLQTGPGNFVPDLVNQDLWAHEAHYEDTEAAMADFDGDGDEDLIVASGGNEFSNTSPETYIRFYRNAGGVFTSDRFPAVGVSASALVVMDVDQDGDQDIIVGGKTIPRHYGLPASSYVFVNDGQGHFSDATQTVAPFFQDIGMVQDISTGDMNGDGETDLLIASEWSPVMIALHHGSTFELIKGPQLGLEHSEGWWNTFISGDFDGDGDLDFIGGNLGLNSKLKADKDHPLIMYLADFDHNGDQEQVLTYFNQGSYKSFATMDELAKQLPSIRKKYNTYHEFAKADIREVFDPAVLDTARHLVAYELANCYFEQTGPMQFVLHELPLECQVSTIEKGLTRNLDRDPEPEVTVVGNFYPVNIQMGRYDASPGFVLDFPGGKPKVIPPTQSGLVANGQCQNIALINSPHYGPLFVVGRNNDALLCFGMSPTTIPDSEQ
ncbi:MAG: VCBS repeat-containing protein [Saprospiraceae bacterium]|nr:VCBS repeat-containing protein [Saprospiraceae bacterium]